MTARIHPDKEHHVTKNRHPLRRALALLGAVLLGTAVSLVAIAMPANANPCNYGKQIYCDGGDEPAWQWNGVDDFECVGIPGATWNSDDTVNYDGVVGQVYFFQNGAYVLVHDSAPAPAPEPAPAAPAPAAPAPAAPAAEAPQQSTTDTAVAQPQAAATTAAPTPTKTSKPAATSKPTTGSAGSVAVSGQLSPGGSISLSGSGLSPRSEFVVEVHSEPRVLTTGAADASGSFAIDAAIPADLEPGVHTVVVLVDGVEVASSKITVIAAGAGAGPDAAAIWLLGGLVVVAAAVLAGYTVVRKRRRAALVNEPAAPSTDRNQNS